MVTKVGAGAAPFIQTALRKRLIVTMRMYRRVGALVAGTALTVAGRGQTHRVAKPETVVRAVAVYEWTGDMAKPAASRVVPVTLFIDQHLEDAGLYLARPIPFALMPEDVYELEQAGVPKGTVELAYARHLQAANTAEAYDDGWFGYGSYKAIPAPKKPITRKPSTQLAKVETSGGNGGSDKPHFSDKTETTPAKADDAKPAIEDPKSNAQGDTKTDTKTDTKSDDKADPDRPTMKRRAADDAATTTPADKSPASGDDPDRPTMKRRTDADPTATATTSIPAPDDPDRPTIKRRTEPDPATTSATSTPAADDPDRPTLKRHTAEDAKKAAKEQSQASVTGTGGLLADDPNRPNLHRGKPTHSMTEADLPKLSGLPIDLQQMVAVSDAANRPMHDFTRSWEDDAERAAVLSKMQSMAEVQLAAYGAPVAAQPQPTRKPDSKRRGLAPVRVGQVKLLDEKLNGYLLSYGDVPTFVYQAHTEGTGADLRYVTIVAQRDAQGEPALTMHSVTDAAHLDRTPRLRLVDAVDVEASNRASLLFEMRGQSSRQFGIYRILGQHAEQIFVTGTTQ